MEEKQTILVLDDHADVRLAITTIIESLGYNFLSYASAKEALADITDKKIDLALVDVMMPEMNGYEFIEEFKKIESFTETPIVMVTAKDQDDDILDGYKYGADYYVTKPFSAKQLEYGIKMFL